MYYRHYVLQIWVIADVMTSFVYRKWRWRLPLVRSLGTCVSRGACASRGWGSRTRKGRPCSGLKDPVVNSTSVVTLSLMWVWCILYWRISLNTEHWKSSCFGFSIEKILYLIILLSVWCVYFLFDWFTFCLMTLLSVSQVYAPDEETYVGRVTKQWSGLGKELFTDADNFGISFPLDLDVNVKATLLGAVFLLVSVTFSINFVVYREIFLHVWANSRQGETIFKDKRAK